MRKATKSNIALLLSIVFIAWACTFGTGTALAASEPDLYSYNADVNDDYVLLEGEIDDDGGDDIYEYGFYYGTDEDDPTDIRIEVGDEISEGESFTYELDVDDLDEDTTYYFVAYARNSEGRGYSSTREFTIDDGGGDDVPEVTTEDVDAGDDSATLYGSIDDDGGDDITEYGFYYGKSRTNMTKVRVGYDIDEGGDFEEDLDDLDEDTTYYFKAYAKNSECTGYGDVESFSTDESDDDDDDDDDSDKPDVTTKTPKFYGNYATLYGIVEEQGDSSIREYGFYWGTDSGCDEKVEIGSDVDEDETFSVNIDDLSSSKTYYVKAYARNASGTAYGDVVKFGGGSLATVSAKVVDSGTGGVILTGTVTNNGGSTITEYGFYWSAVGGTEQQVRFYGNVGQNVPFAYFLTGQPAAQYTFKAYAVTPAGTAYSSPLSFTGAGGGAVVPSVPAGSAPVVLVSSPAPGMTITRGQIIEIASTSTDDVRVDAMGLYINGDKKMRCTGSSFQYYWNTSGLAAGTYNIRVTSWDGALVGEKTVTVYVR